MAALPFPGRPGLPAHHNKPALSGEGTQTLSQVVHLPLATTGLLSGTSEDKVRMPEARGAHGDGVGSRQLRGGHHTCHLAAGLPLSLLLLLLLLKADHFAPHPLPCIYPFSASCLGLLIHVSILLLFRDRLRVLLGLLFSRPDPPTSFFLMQTLLRVPPSIRASAGLVLSDHSRILRGGGLPHPRPLSRERRPEQRQAVTSVLAHLRLQL